ncbi:VanW family protein [Candidatus Roizmanbacteria bacterium]|nr:VanW family protein [Candidatus Roizmanbacteria bacterium]
MVTNKKIRYTYFTKYYVLISLGFILAGILLLQYIVIREKKLDGRIYPNVFIDNTDNGSKTKEEIIAKFHRKNDVLKTVNITMLYKTEPIATFSGERLNIHSDGEEIVERAYLIGRTSHASSRIYQKLATIFNFARYNFYSKIKYDENTLQEFIDTVGDHYNKPAKNALFTFEEGRVSSFRQDEKGLKVNTEKFQKDFESAMATFEKQPENKTITLTDILIEPEITLKDSNQFGIEEKIGEGISDYSHSIPERVHNLTLAASKFHGILIPKGKTFSFNDTVGDISSLTGYKPAYIIKGGKTVLGDGGGVCQVSTTLFRAALNAGLPIVERTAHAYRVIYYENDAKPGLDATVFAPSVDLKFKNNTDAAILIMMDINSDNNMLKMQFFGKNDGRNIELSDITVYDEQPPPPSLYEDDPTLPRGITKQVDFAAWGAKSKYSYKVTKESEILYEKTFYSVYRPWAAAYLVGTAE